MKLGSDLLKNELAVAWLALAVTLFHAGLNSVLYFRGSQVATEAKNVLIYLQYGENKASVLSVAVELVVTNGSPWYGDTLIEASGELASSSSKQTVKLPTYDAIVNPRFRASCHAEGRCEPLKKLAVHFLDEGIKSVPPSGGQVAWISFEVPCQAFGAPCDERDGLASMKALMDQGWMIKVKSKFVHEGEVESSCGFGPIAKDNLDRVGSTGWTSFRCEDAAPRAAANPLPKTIVPPIERG